MPKFRLRLWALLAAILGLSLFQAKVAGASTFEVSPIRITLSTSSSSALLTVRNVSAEQLRFQVSAHAWSQKQTGEMKLVETKDIVFFPAMLSLKPGETRNVRISSLAEFGATEKTYRMFVEELPPLSARTSNAVRVLTRFGIPVFLAPSGRATATPRLDGFSLMSGKLSFMLKNDGNTHFLTQRVRVLAEGSDGSALFDQQLPAWYVLAGAVREYTLDLPASACAAARLVVFVDSDAIDLKSTLPIPTAACRK